MKEDDTAITQDDSGSLHASTVLMASDQLGKTVQNLLWEEYDEWAIERDDPFVVSSKAEFRQLQGDIVTGEYDSDEVLDVRRRFEDNNDDDDDPDQPAKSGSVFNPEGSEGYMFESVDKGRVYVNDPNKVPDEYEIHEGPRGGYYYETGGGSVGQFFDNVSFSPSDVDVDLFDTEISAVNLLRDLNQRVGDKFIRFMVDQMSPDDPTISPEVLLDASSLIGLSQEETFSLLDQYRTGDFVSKGWGSRPKYVDVGIDGQEYTLEVANTSEERYTGMSKYDEDPGHGMLFVYPRAEVHELVFRDMDFPLTVMHIEENGDVYASGRLEESDDYVAGATKYAIEIPEELDQIPDSVEIDPNDTFSKSLEKDMVEGYPDLPFDETPEEVVNWLHRTNPDYDPAEEDDALLYQLLGSGTPPWKMSKEDSDYKSEPEGDAYCGNCEYTWYSNETGNLICSKVRGEIDWEGWCRLWDHAEPDELLESEFGVPDGVEKGSQQADSRLEKIIGGSYHRRRKLRERGSELSAECINQLTQAHKEQVWPKELQKSPSWGGDDDVTQETQSWVDAILSLEDPMWDEYDNVPMAAGLTVKQEIEESLKQPQGWSLNSIDRRLRDEFPQMKPFERQRIARQEVAGILNRSKMAAIEARGEDALVRWVGPDDSNTTELCRELAKATEDGVPYSEFRSLIKEYAEEYGGTPHRSEQGLPHFQCRYTVELAEDNIGKYSPTPDGVPDGAEYLPPDNDPPEGAEVVESDRGATYYLPVGHEEHSDQQATEFIDEAEGELANEIGLDKDKVNLSGLAESEYGEELLESLVDYAQRGWLDEADEISTEWDSQRFVEGGIGVTSRSADSLEMHINPEAMTEDFFQRADEENGLVDPTPRGVVSHEVGHLRRYSADEGINDINFRQSFRTLEDAGNVVDQIDFAEPWMEGMQEDDFREIAERVSQYAASSGAEFVAEVHAALVNGEDLDDEVMSLYGVMGGPEVSQ